VNKHFLQRRLLMALSFSLSVTLASCSGVTVHSEAFYRANPIAMKARLAECKAMAGDSADAELDCSNARKAAVQSVTYYMTHPVELKARIEACNAITLMTPEDKADCGNAERAVSNKVQSGPSTLTVRP
jgi:hypothetical protein